MGYSFSKPMQGLVMCARFLFSPEIGTDADVLYDYVVHKTDDEAAKGVIKKYPAYPMLRLISIKSRIDAFDQRTVEAYWIGSDLLNCIGSEELGLVIKNCSWVKQADRIIFDNMQLPSDKRLSLHHSLIVLLGTLRLSEITPSSLEQINNSLVTAGTIMCVNDDSLKVSRFVLAKEKNEDYYSLKEKEDVISYDPAFVGLVQKEDVIAIHHEMAVAPLTLLQFAALKRHTERNLAVVNKLA